MINKREERLMMILTYLMVSNGTNFGFNGSFLSYVGSVVINMVISVVFYHFAIRHAYKWIVNNIKWG